jgi:hypothetical protein
MAAAARGRTTKVDTDESRRLPWRYLTQRIKFGRSTAEQSRNGTVEQAELRHRAGPAGSRRAAVDANVFVIPI